MSDREYFLSVYEVPATPDPDARITVAMLQPGEPLPALLRITRDEALAFIAELATALITPAISEIERADNGLILNISYKDRAG